MKEINNIPLLSKQEEIEIAKQMSKLKKGSERYINLRNQLINANLRFVVRVAKSFYNGNVPLEDLISYGNEGLIKAAERFDYKRNNRFISYAVHWIKQSITFHLSQREKPIRIPVMTLEKMKKIADYNNISNNPEMSYQEICDKICSISKQNYYNFMIRRFFNFVSLDELVNEDQIRVETIASGKYRPPYEVIENEQLKEIIVKNVNTLPKNQPEIIKMYYGLDGYNRTTLDKIAKRYGLTKERVRQIKNTAEEKLSHKREIKEIYK